VRGSPFHKKGKALLERLGAREGTVGATPGKGGFFLLENEMGRKWRVELGRPEFSGQSSKRALFPRKRPDF
jgi:hypothetical protein